MRHIIQTYLEVDSDDERKQNHEQHLVPKVLAVGNRRLEIVRIDISDGDDHPRAKESRKLANNSTETQFLGRFLCDPVAAIFEWSTFHGGCGQPYPLDSVPPAVWPWRKYSVGVTIAVKYGRDGVKYL